VAGDLVAAVGCLGVRLGRARGDLEAVVRDDNVGAVGTAADFLAVAAVAECLAGECQICTSVTVMRVGGELTLA